MCTASWLHDGGGYDLFFNRDEKLTRKPATIPRISEKLGVRFVAPTDSDFGGTWIAVNEFGISACLVNGAALTGIADCANGRKSRGHLIPEIIAERSAQAMCERVLDADLQDFSAFTMAILSADYSPALIEWDGITARYYPEGDQFMPLTSSSYLPVKVSDHRRAELVALTRSGPLDAARLRSWHASHSPSRGPYAVCMHRNDAETVSFTSIRVDGMEASIEYQAGSPCVSAGIATTRLQLTARERQKSTNFSADALPR